jgi:dihydrofolate reductase
MSSTMPSRSSADLEAASKSESPVPTSLRTKLTLVAAFDQTRLLANENGIPWHLPRDVAHFRATTRDQWLLLGRRTFEEMRGWFQPGHTPILLTSQSPWQGGQKHDPAKIVSSVSEAIEWAQRHGASQLICCGGAKTYAAALPLADQLILTQIHHQFPPGRHPVFFPAWNSGEWQIVQTIHHPAGGDQQWSMDIVTLKRMKSAAE